VPAENEQFAVETLSLTKIFCDWWGRNKILAVDNLDLKVRYNEVFGLLGPNGSGKTTTLKMLLSLLHPTKGRAVVLGGDTRDPKITARIGFLPEESYLYKYLNARETLDFYGRLFGLSSKVRRIRIDALLEMVGLETVANRPVGTFSKGMARRIGLAQALINDPDLLILDEPTTGLDPIGTRQIKDLILQLAWRGKTILLCSHLLADVEDICDRIAILYGGRLQTQGRVKELLQQTDKTQITTGRLSEDALAQIRRIVHAEHHNCETISPLDKLESFFIRIVNKARRRAQPTSGAVSTTAISNFLTADKSTESILDKLAADHQTSGRPPETEEAQPAQPQSDDELLHKLTASRADTETEPLESVEPVDPEPPKDFQPDKDILRQLTNQENASDRPTDDADQSQTGETENA